MRYTKLRNGSLMPVLGLGTWDLRNAACENAVRMALEIGYRHIDTAQAYENESAIGQALAASAVDRDDIHLTTKIWPNHYQPGLIAPAIDRSRAALGTDYLDLVLLHWPPPDEAPLGATLEALALAKKSGKIRAIGVSNFTLRHLRRVVEIDAAEIACNQIEYHALLPQEPIVTYAHDREIVITAHCPLAKGVLSRHELLIEIGHRHGRTATQIALRWLAEQDGVALIPKASSQRHLAENFDIFDFNLTEDDKRLIDGIGAPRRVNNPPWAPKWDDA